MSAAAKDCGMTWTTNHNKDSRCDWSGSLQVSQSQHQAMPLSRIRWQLSVETLSGLVPMACVSNTAKYCIIKVYLQNIHHNNICTLYKC